MTYPDIIKPIYQSENQFHRVFDVCRYILLPKAKGKYLAICEGDDFWCDRHKLQRQYDILEKYPDCCMVTHRVQLCHEDGTLQDKFFPQPYAHLNSTHLVDGEELVKVLFISDVNPFHTCSRMWRRNLYDITISYPRDTGGFVRAYYMGVGYTILMKQ